MNKFVVIILLMGATFLVSCTPDKTCHRKDMCVKINTYTYNEKVKICIRIINNSSDDLYISDMQNLINGLNITKTIDGIESDARFEFFRAPFLADSADGNSEIMANYEPDYSEERKICNVANYGPIARKGFEDTLATALLNYIRPEFYKYVGKPGWDTIDMVKRVRDCLFIPKHSEISDGFEIAIENIDCDELSIQFFYPNSNWDEMNLKISGGSQSIKRQIEETQISYPDTLLGYIHYTKPISSEILHISK